MTRLEEPFASKASSSPPPPPPASVSVSFSGAVGVFLAVVTVYTSTMQRSVAAGDAGELAAAACSFSLPHPTGYPLFVLLYGLVVRIGFLVSLPPAVALNAFSSVLGGAAAGVLQHVIQRLTGSVLLSSCAALSFAFSSAVWTYSGQSEVFALNNLLCALLLLQCLLMLERPTSLGPAIFAAFTTGLAISNQHTSVLFSGPFILFFHIFHARLRSRRALGLLSLSLLVGLSPYLYLPLAANRAGSWGDASTLKGFAHHFLRTEYGTFQLASNRFNNAAIGTWSRVTSYILHISWGLPPFMFGLVALLRSPKPQKARFAICLLLALVCYVGVFSHLNRLDTSQFLLQGVQQRFYQQPDIIVYIFIGVAWAASTLFFTYNTVASVAVVLLGIQTAMNWPEQDMHLENTVERLGHSVLQSAEANSLLLLNGDIFGNSVSYLMKCEGERPNLSVINLGLMTWPWFLKRQANFLPRVVFPGNVYHPQAVDGFASEHFLDANLDLFDNVVLCGNLPKWESMPAPPAYGFKTWLYGMCSLIRRNEWRPANMTAFYERSWSLVPSPSKSASAYSPSSWEYSLAFDFHRRRIRLMRQIMELIVSAPSDELVRLAGLWADELMAASDIMTIDARLIKQCGDIYGRLSKKQQLPYEEKMFASYATYLLKLGKQPDPFGIGRLVHERINTFRQP